MLDYNVVANYIIFISQITSLLSLLRFEIRVTQKWLESKIGVEFWSVSLPL